AQWRLESEDCCGSVGSGASSIVSVETGSLHGKVSARAWSSSLSSWLRECCVESAAADDLGSDEGRCVFGSIECLISDEWEAVESRRTRDGSGDSQMLGANRQLADAFTGGGEHCIRDRRCNHRTAWFVVPAVTLGSRDDVHFDARNFVDAHDAIVVEVALLHAATVERDFIPQRCARAEHDSA